MKIAMVVVLGGDLVRSTEHLGISYIAAYLKQQYYSCEMIEVFGCKDMVAIKKIADIKYDIIGFSTTCVNMKDILMVAEILKHDNPHTHITMGGHMATFWGEKILNDFPYVDSVIRGEGEITFYELTKSIENKTDLSSVDGISYQSSDGIIKNRERSLIKNLDDLPFPVRDQFNQHNNRFQYLRICSSRGCLGNCGFCSSFVGREQEDFKWRGRSKKNVVDEIELLVKEYDFHTFDFIDSTFEDPGDEGKVRIGGIANEILSRDLNIFYNCCFRAENWSDADRDLLRLLVDSGLEKVNIGFEAGNNRGLKILNKRARMCHNNTVIKLLADFPEIYITFGFIMFHPYSIFSDLKDNAKFLYNTGIGQVIRHYFWKLEVYPSTLIETRLIEDDRIKADYDICDGMYEYKFTEKEVAEISLISQKMLNLNEVWDFEIFDIIIHTYITRMKRKYKRNKLVIRLEEFEQSVIKMRTKMAKFNYDFFMNILNTYRNYDIERQQKLLCERITSDMEYIRNIQLKLNHALVKEGYELIKKY